MHGLSVELIWKQLQLKANAILGTENSAVALCSAEVFDSLNKAFLLAELNKKLIYLTEKTPANKHIRHYVPILGFLAVALVLSILSILNILNASNIIYTSILWSSLGLSISSTCILNFRYELRKKLILKICSAKDVLTSNDSFAVALNRIAPLLLELNMNYYQNLKDYCLQLTQALTEKINLIREQATVKAQTQQRECKPDVIIEIRPNRSYYANEIVSSILQPYLTTLILFNQKSSAVISPLLEQLIHSTKKLLDRPWFDLAQNEFCNSLAAALNKIPNTPTPVFQNHALSTTFPVTTTPLRHVADPTRNLAPLDVSEEKINRLCEDPEVQEVTEKYFSKYRFSAAAG